MLKKSIIVTGTLVTHLICPAQDGGQVTNTLNYDPEKLKIIPDKFFEIGIPAFLLYLVLNTIITILKNRAENQLKLKMIEKGVSEQALLNIFKESNAIAKLQPLKWFLFGLATSISLLIIHFSRDYLVNQSGYFAAGIFFLFISAAFIIYYYLLSKKI